MPEVRGQVRGLFSTGKIADLQTGVSASLRAETSGLPKASYDAEAGRALCRKPSRLSWPQAARMSWPRESRMNAGMR